MCARECECDYTFKRYQFSNSLNIFANLIKKDGSDPINNVV